MNPQDFCFWLKGLFELTNTKTLSEQQVEIIKNHLDLVFTKVTPDVEITDLEDEENLETALDRLRKWMEENEKKENPYKIEPYRPFQPYKQDDFWVAPTAPKMPDIICSDGGDKIDTTLYCSSGMVNEDWYKTKEVINND